MKSFLKIISAAVVIAVSFVAPSQASVFVWQDPETGVSASFPDRWQVMSNQAVNDVLTVQAPGAGHYATCTIKTKADQRFAIYPRRYAANIQRVALTEDYWDQYFAAYTAPQIHNIYSDKGLGRGFASMAQASYEVVSEEYDAPRIMKTGIAFSSLYDGVLYSVECASEASVYAQWQPHFLSFIKSVDFEQTTNYNITGYYRDFLERCILKIRGPTIWHDTYH